MKYLFYHEDYICLNINQKIEAKNFYIKYSLKQKHHEITNTHPKR